jgi:arylsulfatase A-like enzyme
MDKLNVVFVLADDLSMNLLPHMPNVRALAADGTTFANYTVTDSLCRPSRSSVFTGRYPHNTGVFTNRRQGRRLNENGTIKQYGNKPEDYLTTVVQSRAVDFISSAAQQNRPFLLEIATYSPHGPFTPAPQDKDLFPGMTVPRTSAFNKHPENAPPYLAANDPLTPKEITTLDGIYRKRARSVQSIDRMIGALRETLATTGVADDTVVVFSSDNGFHLGDHGLNVGKQTAFSTDVHVPLIVAGPGFSLIEHHGPKPARSDAAAGAEDPDKQSAKDGTPPTYTAIRAADWTFVQYLDGTMEYYDRRTDPDEMNNVAATLPAEQVEQLRAGVKKLEACKGNETCVSATR